MKKELIEYVRERVSDDEIARAWEEIDSCWGFFEDYDNLIEEFLPKEEDIA